MRIFYLGEFKSFSTERHVADALDALGHEVYRFNVHSCKKPQVLAEHIVQFDPHFVLTSKVKTPFTFKTAYTWVAWIFDLYFNLPAQINRSVEREQAFNADVIITTDGGNRDNFARYGLDPYVLRQGIPESEKYMIQRERDIDVLFVGSLYYGKRVVLHKRLQQRYGSGYTHVGDKCEVRGHDLNELLARSKVVVGDSVQSPHYWSNRLYEITGRGGFLIHPEVEGLSDECPYVPQYRDAIATCDYYLAHDDEREMLRERQHQWCPTYTQRARELIALCEKHI